MNTQNAYTTINVVDNIRVIDDISKATNPKEFVCLLKKDTPAKQMNLRSNQIVKMYIDPIR